MSGSSAPNESVRVMDELMRVIRQRYKDRPAGSYTTKLFEGGVPKIGEKIVEEANEVIEAAAEEGSDGRAHFVYEVADLVYHTCVMMGYREVDWSEIESELARRFGVSGLEEKASRQQ